METRKIAVEKAVVYVYVIDGGLFKKTVGQMFFGDEVDGYQSGPGFVLSGPSYPDSKPPYAVRYNETAPLDPPIPPPVATVMYTPASGATLPMNAADGTPLGTLTNAAEIKWIPK